MKLNSKSPSDNHSTIEPQKPIETTSAQLEQNPMLAAVQGMPITGKNKLVAIWMSKERVETFKTIDILFYLDDKWNEIYQQLRIKEGFSAAQLKANTHILSLVYGS